MRREANPIELTWAQAKNYVSARNKTFKLPEVKRLLEERLNKVTAHDWEKCCGPRQGGRRQIVEA